MNNSRNSHYFLTDKGLYRICFWRKKGKRAEKIIEWKQTDSYMVKGKEIVFIKHINDSKDFFSIPIYFKKSTSGKTVNFPDKETLNTAIEIIAQKLSLPGSLCQSDH